MRRTILAAGTALLVVPFLLLGTATATATDTGTTGGGSITIASTGPGDPYPSAGTMSGVPGKITSVEVTLTGISHTFPEDLLIVLQSPAGQSVTLLERCGGGTDLVNSTLTFADGSPAAPNPLISGTYSPTQCTTGLALPLPGPGSPYEATLAAMNGFEPNGQWNLWLADMQGLDAGYLTSWTLTVTTEIAAPAEVVAAPAAPELAATGVDATLATLAAGTLLAVGGILMFTRRRSALRR